MIQALFNFIFWGLVTIAAVLLGVVAALAYTALLVALLFAGK